MHAETQPGDLPYSGRVFEEVLRLHPSAHAAPRSTTRAVTVGRHAIPEWSLVMVSTWFIQRDRRWWPDPTRLDPDRHLAGPTALRPRLAWMPFGSGPRACIGAGPAMLEATLVLGHLLARLEVRALEPAPPPVPRVALRPGGPPLKVRRRRLPP